MILNFSLFELFLNFIGIMTLAWAMEIGVWGGVAKTCQIMYEKKKETGEYYLQIPCDVTIIKEFIPF